jgi:hypothetical protein
VAELRGAGDEPDDGDASARRLAADAGNAAIEVRSRHEPSPRAEYADVVRQETAKPNADQADASPIDTDQAGTTRETTDQADAPSDGAPPEEAGQADAVSGGAHQIDSDQVGADQAETDRGTEGSIADALERFDPRRAGLPEVSREEAAAYIEEHQADRPWLAPARDCSPDVQRVIVALDQGGGHAHIRHDGWVTEEMNERRVKNLEDPAQLDLEKREAHLDGIKAGNQSHRCGVLATRITDPAAFATAVARAAEHPDVRAALDSTGPFSVPVRLPISDVLGEDGYKFCAGSQLEPVNGSMIDAVANRTAWVQGDRSVPEPRTRPVETFEGGTLTFTFRPSAFGGHEFNTILVNPPDTQSI